MEEYRRQHKLPCKPIIISIKHPCRKCAGLDDTELCCNTHSESIEPDVNALCKVFRELGFGEPDISLRDAKRETILTGLLEIRLDRSYTEDADFLLCVIIGQGMNGCFKAQDDEDVSIDEVIHIFNTENCIGLRDKPKIFIIQADDQNIYQKKLGAFGVEERIVKLPTQADIFIYYSGIPSWIETYYERTPRDSKEGSIFIQTFCKMLKSDGHLDLHRLTMQINSAIVGYIDKINKSKLKDSSYELSQNLQLPVCTSQMRKSFAILTSTKQRLETDIY